MTTSNSIAEPVRKLSDQSHSEQEYATDPTGVPSSNLLHNSGFPPRNEIIHSKKRDRLGGRGLIVSGEVLPQPTTLRRIDALH